jgi:hypothetical protein
MVMRAGQMNRITAERAARRVGLVTMALGLALVAAPSPFAGVLGADPRALRLIGATDR